MTPTIIPVSVIIVSFNTVELTKKALLALYRSTALPRQIIVVDNNSSDETVAMVKTEFPSVTLIVNRENIGFAKANNAAMRELTDQPFVWLLNSDTETGASSLQELYEYMVGHPRLGAVGPQLVYPTGAWQSVGGYFPAVGNVFSYLFPVAYFFSAERRKQSRSIALYPQPIPENGLSLDYVTGAAVLLRRSALDEVGLLAEDYFMYFEETDLCWRLKQASWERRVIPTEPVRHVYGGSYQKKHDPARLRVFLKSLTIFVKKYYTGWRRSIVLAEVQLGGGLSVWLKQFKS